MDGDSRAGHEGVALPDGPVAAEEGAVHGAQPPGLRRHGVVFVHGIGPSLKSGTLLDFGTPLLQWLERWYRARGEAGPRVAAIDLDFTPVDEGAGDRPPQATVRLPNGDTWMWTEAWWAASIRQPDFWATAWWSIDHLLAIILNLARFTKARFRCLWAGASGPGDRTTPAWWARLIDFLNTLGMLAVYTPLSLAIGLVLLVPLIVVAQVPIPQVQNFFLVHVLRRFLVVNVGQFWTFLEDDFQAANMCRRVADAIGALVDGGAQDVTVVAYSGGCPIAFAVLTSPEYELLARRVTKLVTLGNGLNKAWDIEPQLERIRGTLPGHIHWVDLWGSYDPVPSGWITPPRVGRQGGRRGAVGKLVLNRQGRQMPATPEQAAADADPGAADAWVRIFAPNERVVALQQLTPRAEPNPDAAPGPGRRGQEALYWPVSEQITNAMNVLADHGGYWANDEQFQVRVAAEIDEEVYWHSPFWRGEVPLVGVDRDGLRPGALQQGDERSGAERTAALRQAVEDRRTRVSVWASVRDAALAALIGTTVAFWATLRARHEVGWLDGYTALLPTLGGAAPGDLPWVYWPVPALDALQRFVSHIPALGGLLSPALTAPYWLVGPAIAGAIVAVLCLGLPGAFWGHWDAGARRAAVERIARAGLSPERVK